MRLSACRSKLNSPFWPPSRPTLTMRPSTLAASRFWLATGADTMSTIRSTPLPPVACLTCSGHFGSEVSIARSQQKSLSRARLAALEPAGGDDRVVHGLQRDREAGRLLIGHVVAGDAIGAARVGGRVFGI